MRTSLSKHLNHSTRCDIDNNTVVCILKDLQLALQLPIAVEKSFSKFLEKIFLSYASF